MYQYVSEYEYGYTGKGEIGGEVIATRSKVGDGRRVVSSSFIYPKALSPYLPGVPISNAISQDLFGTFSSSPSPPERRRLVL